MAEELILVSFALCPYVQRAAIALAEKGAPFRRIDIDLADKPAWFAAISPHGKVPLLKVGENVLFESVAILEYLEETQPPPLHPADPLTRARHRAFIEFGSSLLNDVWTLETTDDRVAFGAAAKAVREKFVRLDAQLGAGPFFAGPSFSAVDAVFAPIFRYFDVFDNLRVVRELGLFEGLQKTVAWRRLLSERPSVRAAVASDYPDRLRAFLKDRQGVMGQSIAR